MSASRWSPIPPKQWFAHGSSRRDLFGRGDRGTHSGGALRSMHRLSCEVSLRTRDRDVDLAPAHGRQAGGGVGRTTTEADTVASSVPDLLVGGDGGIDRPGHRARIRERVEIAVWVGAVAALLVLCVLVGQGLLRLTLTTAALVLVITFDKTFDPSMPSGHRRVPRRSPQESP